MSSWRPKFEMQSLILNLQQNDCISLKANGKQRGAMVAERPIHLLLRGV
jgi:hypothetical protein